MPSPTDAPTVLHNIGVLATCREGGGQGALHEIPDAAVAWQGDTIAWAGPEAELPDAYTGARRIDAGGRLVAPGLVDCHTHVCFGGWRADEFAERLAGATYLDIARRGGGIARTVRQTRDASFDELLERTETFLDAMLTLGVTTVEAKSGYGLDHATERKQLEVYAALRERHPMRLVPTYLAHIVPPEEAGRRDAYVRWICDELIPELAAHELAVCCDVFVEETAFSRDEGRDILEAGARAGLLGKVHADQLSDGGGAALAASVGAVSADHLECISADGIAAMAKAGTVAVSLPIASLYLNQPPLPARELIEAGVPVAVATDFNPGSAPSYHLPFAMTLACTMQRMTPAEVLKGATLYAARAAGLGHRVGSVEPGKAADLIVVDAPDVAHWLYHLRANAVHTTILRGHAHPADRRSA